MNRYNYVNDIYCAELNDNIKDFFTEDKIKILSSECSTGQILLGMQFRPDKVSSYYLGDETLYWAISYVNNFTNGIKDYYLGRKILIPSSESINLLTNK